MGARDTIVVLLFAGVVWGSGCLCAERPEGRGDMGGDVALVEDIASDEAEGEADVDPAATPGFDGQPRESAVDAEAASGPDLTHYVGFSEDESSFAYSALSGGAGMHIFTVIDTKSGGRVTDFVLDEASLDRARRLLDEGGFSSRPSDVAEVLARDETILIEARTGEVEVWLVKGNERVRLEPPAAMGRAASRLRRPEVVVWGFSESGRYLAIEVLEDQGPVLGTASTYQILSVPPARVALR